MVTSRLHIGFLALLLVAGATAVLPGSASADGLAAQVMNQVSSAKAGAAPAQDIVSQGPPTPGAPVQAIAHDTAAPAPSRAGAVPRPAARSAPRTRIRETATRLATAPGRPRVAPPGAARHTTDAPSKAAPRVRHAAVGIGRHLIHSAEQAGTAARELIAATLTAARAAAGMLIGPGSSATTAPPGSTVAYAYAGALASLSLASPASSPFLPGRAGADPPRAVSEPGGKVAGPRRGARAAPAAMTGAASTQATSRRSGQGPLPGRLPSLGGGAGPVSLAFGVIGLLMLFLVAPPGASRPLGVPVVARRPLELAFGFEQPG
jgi:hypothetical protein